MGSASKPFGVVYLITNTVNGKVYVGQTTVGVSKRWKGHKDEARKGSECPIHRAIRKYGAASFDVQVVEECSTSDSLNASEKSWVSNLKSTDSSLGYNGTSGGDAGYSFTPEVRAKIAATVSRNYQEAPELLARLSNATKAHFAKPGAREEASIRAKRVLSDPSLRDRLSVLGKKSSLEHPECILALNAYNRSDEGRRHNSERHKQFHQAHPNARVMMSKRQLAALTDPSVRQKTIDALAKGRSIKAERRGPWASISEVRLVLQGLSVKAYHAQRPPNMPTASSLQKVYGKTFREIRDGYRRGAPGNSTAVDEGILRVALQGLTSIQYDAQRRSKVLDARFVSSNAFPRVYGKTFMEVRDGVRDPRQTKRRAA